jgi:hypothetical protein
VGGAAEIEEHGGRGQNRPQGDEIGLKTREIKRRVNRD